MVFSWGSLRKYMYSYKKIQNNLIMSFLWPLKGDDFSIFLVDLFTNVKIKTMHESKTKHYMTQEIEKHLCHWYFHPKKGFWGNKVNFISE